MLQYVVGTITFVSLWVTLVLLNYVADGPRTERAKRFPLVSIVIPAYDEQDSILKTVQSLLDADYPKKEIIVVSDGSTDNTVRVVRKFMKQHPGIQLIDKKNGGKASAVNAGLAVARGELFAVMDADSRIDPQAIRALIPHFSNPQAGAVITRIRVDKPILFLERMQRFEYIMSSLTRFMMRNFGTLAITHGVMTMFRTKTLRELGGFVKDRNNITEDFEIALRLRRHGFLVEMEPKAIGYTRVPRTVHSVWRQRLRWSRGYLYNMMNYRDLFFAKGQGVFGAFQLPMNVIGVLLLVLNVGLISFDVMHRSFDFLRRSLSLPDYFWNTILDFPSLKEFILARNIQVTIPVLLSLVLGIYLVVVAHRLFNERIGKQIFPALVYVMVVPYFTAANWISSIAHEVVRTKRKW